VPPCRDLTANPQRRTPAPQSSPPSPPIPFLFLPRFLGFFRDFNRGGVVFFTTTLPPRAMPSYAVPCCAVPRHAALPCRTMCCAGLPPRPLHPPLPPPPLRSAELCCAELSCCLDPCPATTAAAAAKCCTAVPCCAVLLTRLLSPLLPPMPLPPPLPKVQSLTARGEASVERDFSVFEGVRIVGRCVAGGR
jgi:hypothetical protein